MKSFITVKPYVYEYETNKSRFIGICKRVNSCKEAVEEISAATKQYKDATHVCYAFVSGDGARSNDAGEPAGTAGAPIAEAIKNAGTLNTLVIVVRYFGGIKLGAGGLTRAYHFTASQTLLNAQKTEIAECETVKASLQYSVWKKIEKMSFQSLYKILRREYNSTVDIYFAATDANSLIAELNAVTQGKCECSVEGAQTVERYL